MGIPSNVQRSFISLQCHFKRLFTDWIWELSWLRKMYSLQFRVSLFSLKLLLTKQKIPQYVIKFVFIKFFVVIIFYFCCCSCHSINFHNWKTGKFDKVTNAITKLFFDVVFYICKRTHSSWEYNLSVYKDFFVISMGVNKTAHCFFNMNFIH